MAEIVEAYAVQPVFCDALARVEVDRHGIARLMFVVDQSEAHAGTVERIVAARLIMPAAVLDEVVGRLQGAARGQVCPVEAHRAGRVN